MYKIAVIGGDHVGPEVVREGVKVLKAAADKFKFEVNLNDYIGGGCAIDKYNDPLPKETIEGCRNSDAILFGSVGGPKWDDVPWTHVKDAITPSRAIQGLRKEFQLFANIRPAYLHPALINNIPVKPEVAKGTDFVVVREQCGGVYVGEPRGIYGTGEERYGTNGETYSVKEVRRVAHVAFKLARTRRSKVTSVDKANVLESSILWREIVKEVAKEYPDVQLNHLYADATAMKIIENPLQFDVILTGNIFGDILSDLSSVLTGSIGMMPSASIGYDKFGLYEPIHGSAPDIVGKDIANPLATILSVAMMLEYSLDEKEAAQSIRNAVNTVLNKGYRTSDLYKPGDTKASSSQMGNLVAEEILR